MAPKYAFAFFLALSAVQYLEANDRQSRDIGSDLIHGLLSKALPVIDRYFDPFSGTVRNAAEIVEALLKDLNNRTGAYLLNTSSVFQNLRDVVRTLQPRLQNIGEDIASCIITEKGDVLDIIRVTEKEAQACALGLVAQIQPLAVNISQTVTQIQDVAVQSYPTITDCVTSNAANPIALPRCLSKVIGPVFNEVSKVAAKVKSEFRKYEEEKSNFQTQLQQCGTDLRATVASVESLVQGVRQCVSEKEQNASS